MFSLILVFACVGLVHAQNSTNVTSQKIGNTTFHSWNTDNDYGSGTSQEIGNTTYHSWNSDKSQQTGTTQQIGRAKIHNVYEWSK